jgi:hypothetical protein
MHAAPNDLPQPVYEGDVPEPDLFEPPGGITMNDVDGIRMNWDGEKLDALMRACGFNQSSLGRAVGVSQPTVWRWIQGQAPSEHCIRQLGVVLGLGEAFGPNDDVSPLRVLFTRDGQAHILSQSAIFQAQRNGRG